MKQMQMLGAVLVGLSGLAASVDADVLRVPPESVQVIREGEDAVLLEMSYRVEGMRSGANRWVAAAYLEGTMEGLEGESAPVFAVEPAAQESGADPGDWTVLDEDTALDVERMGASRLARAGGYVRLDVTGLGWERADGTTLRLAVLATGVDPESVTRQAGALDLVIRYAFLPEDVLDLVR